MPAKKSLPLAFLIVVLALGSLGSCASLDQHSVAVAGHQADDSNLVSAEPYFLKPAALWRGAMSWVSLPILGGSIDTKLLTAINYEQWRKARIVTMSDVQAVVLRFDTEIMPGQADRQSGMLFLPAARSDRTIALNWIIWCKGTELQRDKVPSRFDGVEANFAATFASLGYAIWMPDYAGMGDSPGVQTYCVPASLGLSAVDGLRAARHYLAENHRFYRETGKLHVMGYSEGGMAAMASMREMAKNPDKIRGLNLSSVYSMGAPLNLMLGYGRTSLDQVTIGKPEYSLALAIGWARAYPGQIKLDEILRPAIISKIVPLFDGSRDGDSLHRAIAKFCGKKQGQVNFSDLFRTEYLTRFANAQESLPYYQLQTAERLDRQAPPSGTNLILAASRKDTIVNPDNSWTAFQWLQANQPESQVQLIELGSADHISAGGEALLYAIRQIDRDSQATVIISQQSGIDLD